MMERYIYRRGKTGWVDQKPIDFLHSAFFKASYELHKKMKRKQIPSASIMKERLIYYDYINDERLANRLSLTDRERNMVHIL